MSGSADNTGRSELAATTPIDDVVQEVADELAEALWWTDSSGECAIHIRRALDALEPLRNGRTEST